MNVVTLNAATASLLPPHLETSGEVDTSFQWEILTVMLAAALNLIICFPSHSSQVPRLILLGWGTWPLLFPLIIWQSSRPTIIQYLFDHILDERARNCGSLVIPPLSNCEPHIYPMMGTWGESLDLSPNSSPKLSSNSLLNLSTKLSPNPPGNLPQETMVLWWSWPFPSLLLTVNLALPRW